MTKSKNIFLIGPMGAGKSSVGRTLAQRLALDFYDTDEEIEKRTGVNIAWIFDLEGEGGFRQRESAIISELVLYPNIVLATGGGAVLSAENRALLSANGTVIYLAVSLDEQRKRMAKDSKRPLLQVKNREEILEKLLYEREPLYEEIADICIPTNESTVHAVVKEILKQVNLRRRI